MITARRGDGTGYIALDEFKFEHSSGDAEYCTIRPDDATPTVTTTAPPTPHPHLPSCDFEQDACNWEIMGLAFKWEIVNDTVLDDNSLLGPVNSAGNFLYANPKDGVAGEVTYLTSPTFEAPEKGACLRFRFAMEHHGGIKHFQVKMGDTVIWNLTDHSAESIGMWEEGQVLVQGDQVKKNINISSQYTSRMTL